MELWAVVSDPDAMELPDSLIETVSDAAELPSCVVSLVLWAVDTGTVSLPDVVELPSTVVSRL